MTENRLILKVETTDDRHLQSNEAAQSWKADGIQIALAIPGIDGHWELGFARNNDGQDSVHAWPAPVGMSTTYAKQVGLKTIQTDDGDSYQDKLPFDRLRLDAEFLRSRAIRFNILVNDEDGGGREGFLYLSPGFGKAQPNAWPLINFE